ncbi:MAG TPA: hypothetical protein VL793_10965, partial [Patescibacteria group bacterium]|nr:hypothetical protein [Patescibacteria group bacterium]
MNPSRATLCPLTMLPFWPHGWLTFNAIANMDGALLRRNSIRLFYRKEFIIGAIWMLAAIKDFLRLSLFLQ